MKIKYYVYIMLVMTLILSGCKKDESIQQEDSQNEIGEGADSNEPLVEGLESETEYVGEGQPEPIEYDISYSDSYQPKETITVGIGTSAFYELTIDEIKYTDSRDEYVPDPGNVLLVTYTYKNLSEEALLIDDMSFQMMLSDEVTLLNSYYLADIMVPEPIEKGGMCTAQIAYSIEEKVDSVVLVYRDIINTEISPIKIVNSNVE